MTSDATPLDGTREIESRIITFIQHELLSPDTTVDREDDLLSGELLDSIAVLRLSVFVEEEFQLVVQPADYVIENGGPLEETRRQVRTLWSKLTGA